MIRGTSGEAGETEPQGVFVTIQGEALALAAREQPSAAARQLGLHESLRQAWLGETKGRSKAEREPANLIVVKRMRLPKPGNLKPPQRSWASPVSVWPV